MPDGPIETINDFGFGANGSAIRPLVPVLITTQQQAFRTAAWILCLAEVLSDGLPAEDPPSSFENVLHAIRNT